MDAQHSYNHLPGPYKRLSLANGNIMIIGGKDGDKLADTYVATVEAMQFRPKTFKPVQLHNLALLLAAPTMFDALLKWAEFVGPDDGNLHCIECDRIGDPDPTVVMEHESDCDLGNAIKQARGTT